MDEYEKSQAARFTGHAVQARHRLKKAFRFFKSFVNPNLPLLDIGVRDGWFIEYLGRKKFNSIQGIEIVEDAVKFAQDRGRNVVWGDAHDLSAFSQEFGTVLMIHSLEHCYDPAKVVENVHRILVPEGIFFVEVPLEDEVKQEVAHFCHFASVRDVTSLIDKDRFELLRSKAYSLGKAQHLMCAFRKR